VSDFLLNSCRKNIKFRTKALLLLQPEISLRQIVPVVATVIGIAVLASLQPAWKAAKMDPITALRHV